MLRDPLKERLDLRAILIKCSDDQGQQDKIVDQGHKRLDVLGVFESNIPKILSVMLCDVKHVKQCGLILNEAGPPIDLRKRFCEHSYRIWRSLRRISPPDAWRKEVWTPDSRDS